jgi:hypothetical protein
MRGIAVEDRDDQARRNQGNAEDWNRTSDTSIFSAVLYRLSYLGVRNRARTEPSS